MRIGKLLVCFVLFVFSTLGAHSQNPAVKDSFTFEYNINDSRLIILDLLVNDTMKMKVMFDTGAIWFLPADSLPISDKTFKNPTTLRLSEHTVKEYYEYPEGNLDYINHKNPIFKLLGIGGILGWNFFEDMIVSFSIDKREGVIFDRLPDDISDFSKIPMTKDERHWSIPVTIMYKDVLMNENLLVDFGASGTATLNNGIVEKYNLVIEDMREGGSTATSGGVERRNVMSADELMVGDFHVYNRSVAIRPPSRSTPFSGIIGMGFFEDFDIILDFKEGNLYLKKVD